LKWFALMLATAVVTGLMVGCGGSSSSSPSGTTASSSSGESSKADYVMAADAVCTEYQGDTAPLRKEAEEIEESANPESPKNLVRLAEILQEADVRAEREYTALKELEPPAADQSLIESMLGKAEEAAVDDGDGAEALEEGELSKFSEIEKEAAPLNTQAKGMAEGYGFKVCGQAE
jgi:hypothetical protein